jgi:hypothetical protein
MGSCRDLREGAHELVRTAPASRNSCDENVLCAVHETKENVLCAVI